MSSPVALEDLYLKKHTYSHNPYRYGYKEGDSVQPGDTKITVHKVKRRQTRRRLKPDAEFNALLREAAGREVLERCGFAHRAQHTDPTPGRFVGVGSITTSQYLIHVPSRKRGE